MKTSNLSMTLVRIHLIPVIGLLISAGVLLMSCGNDKAVNQPVTGYNNGYNNVPGTNPYMNNSSWGNSGYIVNGQLCFKDANGNPNSSIPCTSNYQSNGTYATYVGPNGQQQVISLLGPTYPFGANGNYYNGYYTSSPWMYGNNLGWYPWYNGGNYWVGNVPFSNCNTFSFGGFLYGYLYI